LRLDQLDIPGTATAERPMTLRMIFDVDAEPGTALKVTIDLARKEAAETTETSKSETPTEKAESSARSRLRRYRRGAESAGSGDAAKTADAATEFPLTTTGVVDSRGQVRLTVPVKVALPGYNQFTIAADMTEPAAELEATAPIFISDDRPRILMIAERPDRLATAILSQRSAGTVVYPVFTYGREARAKRGSTRGDIPEKPEDWQQYDLVILLGRPFPGYTAEDGAAISRYLLAGDLSVLVSGPGGEDYIRSFGALQVGDAEGDALRPADHLLLNPQTDHLPGVRLRGEVISNFNVWQSLGAPADIHAVPPQDMPLLLHPESRTPVLSLGIHGAGKLMIMGMAGLEPMLAWQTAEFDRVINRLTTDLLTPIYHATSHEAKLAAYPSVGTAGRPVILLAPAGDAQGPVTVSLDGPTGSESVELSPRDGWLRGAFKPAEPGEYVVTTPTGALSVQVRAPVSAETRDTSLDTAFLREYAAAAGGRYVPLAELAEAVESLPERHRTHVDSQTWRLLDQRVALLLIFLCLAVADFSLRKILGLVL
jgi:hypothetical protein